MRQILLILMITLLSCDSLDSWLDMDAPAVTRIEPADGSRGVHFRPVIFVEFSEEMDKPKTEESFIVIAEQGSPRGYCRWSGKKLYFDLVEDLKNGVYTIRVSAGAEDINGNNIYDAVESQFSVGTDFEKPIVIATVPADGEVGVERSSSLLITFSEAIAPSHAGITVSPPLMCSKSFTDGRRTLVISPYTPMEKGVYTVTLDDRITDIAGNPLLEEHVFSFLVGDDFTAPTLDAHGIDPPDERTGVFADDIRLSADSLSEGIEKDALLRIVFSEPMKRLETVDAITVVPAGEYEIRWGDDGRSITLSLKESLRIDQVYEIRVADTALDCSDNRLDREYVFPIRVNGARSQALSVNEIRQMQWAADGSGPDEGEPGSILLPDATFDLGNHYCSEKIINGTQEQMCIVRIIFQNGNLTLEEIGIDEISALQSVHFSLELSYGNEGLAGVQPVVWKLTRAHPQVIDMYLFNLQLDSYYRLSVVGNRQGIRDREGNYMLQDFKVFFNCAGSL